MALRKAHLLDKIGSALIQVGEIYFVEDGHHRLSVAHARGEQTIEAEVIVWEVAGSLPWEQPTVAHG